MARKDLQKRKNWQTASGPAGASGQAEQNLYSVFEEYFVNTKYELVEQPDDFKHLYENVVLPESVSNRIYNPTPKDWEHIKKVGWGVKPDFAIKNKETGKTLFGEIKRQDGWIESTLPLAGRGNAHERLGKLFSPGLIKIYREKSKISSTDILPFWVVFEGNITRDPRRNREIAFWFDKYKHNYFMWYPGAGPEALINHFNDYLKKYLD